MKKNIFLILAIMLLSFNVFAQHAIRASHAVNHIGQQVVVVDSITDVKIYNDSTAVIDMGGQDCLKVMFNFNSPIKFNSVLLGNLKESLVEVSGFVVLIADKPTIIVNDKNKLYFFSNTINQNWALTSQLAYKRN